MNIAIVGYGKMGKIIEQIAMSRGHKIVAKLNETPTKEKLNTPDVVIEFSMPEFAFQNIKTCIELGIPVVSGTTGWLEQKHEIDEITLKKNGAFLYGSNFSLGVNLFFELNKKLAKLMHPFSEEYICELEEIHHTHKKDAPSGTAISLAEDVISNSHYQSWKKEKTEGNQLGIISVREDEVPGTHSVFYRSAIDEIEIKHTAFSREGFALGAVLAAEWIIGRKGVFGMKDVLFGDHK